MAASGLSNDAWHWRSKREGFGSDDFPLGYWYYVSWREWHTLLKIVVSSWIFIFEGEQKWQGTMCTKSWYRWQESAEKSELHTFAASTVRWTAGTLRIFSYSYIWGIISDTFLLVYYSFKGVARKQAKTLARYLGSLLILTLDVNLSCNGWTNTSKTSKKQGMFDHFWNFCGFCKKQHLCPKNWGRSCSPNINIYNSG